MMMMMKSQSVQYKKVLETISHIQNHLFQQILTNQKLLQK